MDHPLVCSFNKDEYKYLFNKVVAFVVGVVGKVHKLTGLDWGVLFSLWVNLWSKRGESVTCL
jgi:hypothetical protein